MKLRYSLLITSLAAMASKLAFASSVTVVSGIPPGELINYAPPAPPPYVAIDVDKTFNDLTPIVLRLTIDANDIASGGIVELSEGLINHTGSTWTGFRMVVSSDGGQPVPTFEAAPTGATFFGYDGISYSGLLSTTVSNVGTNTIKIDWSIPNNAGGYTGYFNGGTPGRIRLNVSNLSLGQSFLLTEFPVTTPPAITVSGTVDLQDIDGDEAGLEVEIEVRNVGSTTPLETHTVTLGAGGSYSFNSNLAAGTYDVAAKGSHWLRQLDGSVTFAAGGATANFSLVNGDADPDNEVNLVDAGRISAAFGSVDGDPNWNPLADLNEDGEVNLVDWGIMSARFGQAGDE